MARTSSSLIMAYAAHGMCEPSGPTPVRKRARNWSSVQFVMCPVAGSGVRFGVTNTRVGSPSTSISKPPANRGTRYEPSRMLRFV
jgi:hypothetical protein